MARPKGTDKPSGSAHVDQEKSTDDIFEHVIRGVRLSRLRELLRRRKENDEPDQERNVNVWSNAPEPRTA